MHAAPRPCGGANSTVVAFLAGKPAVPVQCPAVVARMLAVPGSEVHVSQVDAQCCGALQLQL